MRYLSLDLETTSLVPDENNILQMSFVLEDTSDPTRPVQTLDNFTCFIKQDEIKGQPYALAMNAWILDIISGRSEGKYPILSKEDAFRHLKIWLIHHFGNSKPVLAGKNVGTFDFQFLPKDIQRLFSRRFIDPGPMLIDWHNDEVPPGLTECLRRSGINTEVTHDARQDAIDVIEILRRFYV